MPAWAGLLSQVFGQSAGIFGVMTDCAFEQFDIFHQAADCARLRIGVRIEKYEHIAFSGGSGQMFGGRNAQPLFMAHDLDFGVAMLGRVDRAIRRTIVGDDDFVIERSGGGLSQLRAGFAARFQCTRGSSSKAHPLHCAQQ